ncbi:hypothetical protein D9M70_595780 [compost metagenome]
MPVRGQLLLALGLSLLLSEAYAGGAKALAETGVAWLPAALLHELHAELGPWAVEALLELVAGLAEYLRESRHDGSPNVASVSAAWGC